MNEKNLDIRFVDLFSGIGGIREGFEQACEEKGISSRCVFTSEIKHHAINVLKQNHPHEEIAGDITKIDANIIPDFDILLAGFPCQAFSFAGKRLGFEDTRGTLFFEVARILEKKQPKGFILENVEGLITHDKINNNEKIGRTFKTILKTLNELGYCVSWTVLNARYFGVPQERKRVYIVGTNKKEPNLSNFPRKEKLLSEILESGLKTTATPFIKLLLNHYTINELYGKSIKDKRGGSNNIHSWDIALRGEITNDQKKLMNQILKERRKKKWALEFGIEWMDGMPLTLSQIQTFNHSSNLEWMLKDLTDKGYLKKEHPKQRIKNKRVEDNDLPLGYNIVTGKMSFEINKILDPSGIAPTLVAMDMQRLYVPDEYGLRPLSLREGLRLFGYPETFNFDTEVTAGYDLLGNTVVVPVIKAVSLRILETF